MPNDPSFVPVPPQIPDSTVRGVIDDGAVFPVKVSRDARGGPGFATLQRQSSEGWSYRMPRYSRPLCSWDVSHARRSDDFIAYMLKFLRGRRGALRGFRFRDPFDWTTAPDGQSAPSTTDYTHRHCVGAGDGSATQWQLVKWYRPINSRIRRPRPITRPTYAGVEAEHAIYVWIDGVLKTVTTDYSIGTSNGVLTFTSPPAAGSMIEWAGTFHVASRFDTPWDERSMARLTTAEVQDILGMPVVEIREAVDFADGIADAGGYRLRQIPASQHCVLTLSEGMLQDIQPLGSGTKVFLPQPLSAPPGGPYVIVRNVGSAALSIVDANENAVVTSLAVNAWAELWIDDAKGWVAR